MKTKHATRHAILRQLLSGPKTAKELLVSVRPSRGCAASWGNSYFLPHQGGNGWRSSLIVNGWITPVGKSGRARLYAITAMGMGEIAHLLKD